MKTDALPPSLVVFHLAKYLAVVRGHKRVFWQALQQLSISETDCGCSRTCEEKFCFGQLKQSDFHQSDRTVYLVYLRFVEMEMFWIKITTWISAFGGWMKVLTGNYRKFSKYSLCHKRVIIHIERVFGDFFYFIFRNSKSMKKKNKLSVSLFVNWNV